MDITDEQLSENRDLQHLSSPDDKFMANHLGN